MTRSIAIKRVYEEADRRDGFRVLVDRLWPRGLSKEKAKLDRWTKELAPSDELRRRYHDDGDFQSFARDYRKELDRDEAGRLLEEAGQGPLTLLYASKDERRNNAAVLRDYLDELQSNRE